MESDAGRDLARCDLLGWMLGFVSATLFSLKERLVGRRVGVTPCVARPSIVALLIFFASSASAQLVTVQGTIQRADGSTPSGTAVISWGAFVTQGGVIVPQGSKTITITNGVVNTSLYPNANSNPPNMAYSVVYSLGGAPNYRKQWFINPTPSPVQVTQIEYPPAGNVGPYATVSPSQLTQAGATLNECLIFNGNFWTPGTCSGSGATGFNTLTSGTNTTAAMVLGSGSSLTYSGTGSNNANKILGSTITGLSGSTGKLLETAGSLTSVNLLSADSSGNAVDSGIPGTQVLVSSGSYPSPSWLPSLAASKLTGSVPCANMPALTGDATTVLGNCVASVVATAGLPFAASATTDTTVATNISSGTLNAARLPAINLAASGAGGVTGNLPVTNLNGGTSASSTTCWYGDGTWKNCTGGTVTNTSGMLTAGRVVVGNSGNDITVLSSAGTTTTLLHGNAGGNPSFSAVDLTADVINLLPTANGGLGSSSIAFTGPSGGAKSFALPNASSTILTSNTPVTLAQGGTGADLSSVAKGGLIVGTAANTVALKTVGTDGQVLTADAASTGGVKWAAVVGTGTVTSIATTSPITGGTITTTGTIACPTCVTSAAALTTNRLVIGAGSQASAVLGSLGTTTTVLHGNNSGAPSFAAVDLTAEVTGALPIANGGTGTASTLTGLVRGSASAMTAAELSGDATTSGSNAVTVAKINGATLGSTTATDANILIANGSSWIARAVSGDVTIGDTGVTAIGAAKVTNAMLAGSIDLTSKVTGVLPVANGGARPVTTYSSGDYTWTRSPSGTLSVGSNTVTLSAGCPVGLNGSDSNHKIFVNDSSPASVAITSVNAKTTPMSVITSSAHGLSTGAFVNILCPTVVNAACGPFTITVTGSTGFTLDNSAPPATFEIGFLSNASPIVVRWRVRPGLSTGDSITISGSTGNTAANGTFTYTRINDFTGSLNSSTGNADYTGGATATFTPTLGGTATVSSGPESVLITGGTCTSGAGSGTVIFTAKNAHIAGYTLSSATAGITEMINVATAASVYSGLVPSGTNNMQDGAVLPDNFKLFGASDMSSVLKLNTPGAPVIQMLSISGTSGSSTTTSTSVSFASRNTASTGAITLASTTGISAGTHLVVTSGTEGTYGNSYRQMAVVDYLSGSVATLRGPLVIPLIGGNSVAAYTPAHFTVQNLTLDGNSQGWDRVAVLGINGISATSYEQSTVDNVRFLNFTTGSGISGTNGSGNTFSNLYFDNSGSENQNDFMMFGCTQCAMSNITSSHASGFGPGTYSWINSNAANITVQYPMGRAFKHQGAAYSNFSNIAVTGGINGNGLAITQGCFNNTFTGVTANGNEPEGIWFSSQDNEFNTIDGVIAQTNTNYGLGVNEGAHDFIFNANDHDNNIRNYSAQLVYDFGTNNTFSPAVPARSHASITGAAQSIPSGTYTAISFDTNDYDVGGMHSTSVNPTRFTIPTGQGGHSGTVCAVWHLSTTISLAASGGSELGGQFYKNGSITTGFATTITDASNQTGLAMSADVVGCDGDYFEIRVIQTTGGAVNTQTGPFMSISRAW